MKHALPSRAAALALAAMLALAGGACNAEPTSLGGIVSDVASSLKALAGIGDGKPEAEKPAAKAEEKTAAKPAPQAAKKPEEKPAKAPEKQAEQKPEEKPAKQTVAQTKAAEKASAPASALSNDPGNDRVDANGETALLRAARGGRLDSVKQLIEGGSNVNYVRPKSLITPLSEAAGGGHLDVVKLLLASGAEASTAPNLPLIRAAANGHEEIAKILIERGADLNTGWPHKTHTDDQWTPLFYATENGHAAIVKLLLAAKADANHIDAHGESALLRALRQRDWNTEIIQALLDAGANASFVSKHDAETPLLLATQKGKLEMVQMIKEKGADINAKDRHGSTALNIALSNGNKGIIDELIAAKAALNGGRELGQALYHYNNESAYWLDVIKRLLAAGANVNAITQTYHSYTVNPWKENGSSILMAAVHHGYPDVVKVLIDAGADVNAVAEGGDYKGWNALNIALERRGHLGSNEEAAKQITEMLRAAGAHE